MEHRWIHLSAATPLPPFAVIGGHDSDMAPIYVGRAFHEGDNLPAKVIPSKGCAYVCWGGSEIPKTHYEILTGEHYRWVPCAVGVVPPNAVLAGNTRTGEPLYIGRGHWQGSLTVGKIHPSHHCLYIPFGGHEHRLETYEVLIHEQPHGWVIGQTHNVPPNTVVAGHDSDRATIYVGRAMHEGHNWVPSSLYSPIPPLAVVGGHDMDGSVIYVGRSFHEGDMLAAKVIPSRHEAYVSWHGQEVPKTHFEILCGNNYHWRPCHDHSFPPNAVECGKTKLGQKIFIGRAHFEGSLTVGKVSSVHRALFIPYGGIERRIENYEILVRDAPVATDWITCSGHSVPSNAVHAGHDADMAPIYVGRAYYNGDLIPGKVIPSRGCAYVCHNGNEIMQNNFEVLTGYDYRWVSAADGYAPPEAVEGGRTVQGEPLFIGRAHYCGSLTPGKLHKSHGCLYIPFAGLERRITSYEVLVRGRVKTACYPPYPPPYSEYDSDKHHHHHDKYPPPPPPPPPYNPGYGAGFKVKF